MIVIQMSHNRIRGGLRRGRTMIRTKITTKTNKPRSPIGKNNRSARTKAAVTTHKMETPWLTSSNSLDSSIQMVMIRAVRLTQTIERRVSINSNNSIKPTRLWATILIISAAKAPTMFTNISLCSEKSSNNRWIDMIGLDIQRVPLIHLLTSLVKIKTRIKLRKKAFHTIISNYGRLERFMEKELQCRLMRTNWLRTSTRPKLERVMINGVRVSRFHLINSKMQVTFFIDW